MTDGAFRHDGTIVTLPEPDAAVVGEAWRKSLQAEIVRLGWLEEDAATGMRGWPNSGFGACLGPQIE
jgi:hypothetical protein